MTYPPAVLSRWRPAFMFVSILIGSTPAMAEDTTSQTGPTTTTLPAQQTGTSPEYTRLKLFPRNLGGNTRALFNRKSIAPFLIGGLAGGALAFADHGIRDDWSIRSGDSTIGTVGAHLGGTHVVAPAIATLLVLGHYARNDRFHSFTYSLAQATAINLGLVQGLKYSTRRTRPGGRDKHSFPSGHSASAFTIAAVVQGYYGRTAGILANSAAAFVAVSRVRENEHWASDVAAGATIGYIVGSSVFRRTGISLRVRRIVFFPVLDIKNHKFGLLLH